MEISSDQLRQARNLAGLSQTQLAERLGVGMRTVQYWETRTGVPRGKEGKVRAVLGSHLDANRPRPPLRSFSDAELLMEIAWRMSQNEQRSVDPSPEGSGS